MKRLEADIKNKNYRNIYALYGPQSYLRKWYTDKLTRIFVADGDTMNLTSFYGKKTDIKEVIDVAVTLPFMAEKRVVILEDTGFLSHSCEELADLFSNMPEETVMIFSEEEFKKDLKHVKLIASSGSVTKFDNPTREDLEKMVQGKLAREHRQITRSALNLFLDRCPDDLWQMFNELEKLISYTFGKDGIHAEDVEAVCAPSPEDKIFEMIDAILAGRTKFAMKLYGDLLLLQTKPSRVISLIRDQLSIMLHVREMARQKINPKEMATILHVKEGRAKMALRASQKSSKIFLTKGMSMCAETEERFKTGLVEEQIGVETLIIELCNIVSG